MSENSVNYLVVRYFLQKTWLKRLFGWFQFMFLMFSPKNEIIIQTDVHIFGGFCDNFGDLTAQPPIRWIESHEIILDLWNPLA